MTTPDNETTRPRPDPMPHAGSVAVAMSAQAADPSTAASPAASIQPQQSGTTVVAQGVPAEQVLQDTLRQLDEARQALAEAKLVLRADRSVARESLEKAQDLGAEVFRVRDQLKLARLDADESYARVLDLEMEVHQQQARLADLQGQNERLGEHLRQALALHHEDGVRWQSEVARILEAHQHDTAVWQAEVERLHHLHDETARVMGEVLGSRSWRMTRGIRRVVEHFRGHGWAEPETPADARGTSGVLPRATPDPHGDD